MGFLLDEFGREQGGQQAFDAAAGEQQIGWQVGVHGVGDLVDVVPDAAQLGEQRGVHGLVGRTRVHLDFAFEHQPLA